MTTAAVLLVLLLPPIGLLLVCAAMLVYDRARSARLDAELAALQAPKLAETSTIPEGVEMKFYDGVTEEEDDPEYREPDLTTFAFEESEFSTEKDQATLLAHLKATDPTITHLELTGGGANDGKVLRPARRPCTSPDALPRLTNLEMSYHMAGHAVAGAELSGAMMQEEQTALYEQRQAETAAYLTLKMTLDTMTTEQRERVRLLLDQANADAAAADEEFYHETLAEAGVPAAPPAKHKAPGAKKKAKKGAKKRN